MTGHSVKQRMPGLIKSMHTWQYLQWGSNDSRSNNGGMLVGPLIAVGNGSGNGSGSDISVPGGK